jgi:hypothetical protein
MPCSRSCALAGVHPADAAVRENLRMGVAKTLLDAADEGRAGRAEDLGEELKSLAEAHPEDSWVEQFRSLGLLG